MGDTEKRELTKEELEKVTGGTVAVLGGKETDNITVSYVKGGKTYTTTFKASEGSIVDIFGRKFSDGSDKNISRETGGTVAADMSR